MFKAVPAIFVFSFLLVLSGCKAKAPENTQQIVFKDGKFEPQNVSIKVDQTVNFVNQSDEDIWPASNIHPTHGIYPQFDSQKPINPGKSWSFTFTRAGTWKFHDHLQPEITGEIKVE